MKLSQNEYKELDQQIDMLRGNINRMCVTDELDELEKMYEVAKYRLDQILYFNAKRFAEEE